MRDPSPPVLLTQGDPAGIGPEITLRAWLERKERSLPPFAWVGDRRLLEGVRDRLRWDAPIRETELTEVERVFDSGLPVIALPAGTSADILPGRPDPKTAAGTIASITEAVKLVKTGDAAAVVTNPIAKHVLYEAGFSHPGHTEFLAELARSPEGPAPQPVMMLWSEELAVVPVTVHVPLSEVPRLLTRDRLVETARIVARELTMRFGIASPRLSATGLNPHAGESGTMGHEDAAVIAPAIAQLRAEGIDIHGPVPADTMFHARARARYDVALAMYHDQALIPIKTIAFDEAVNVTLGLPFIRTSPDHGTAFDIAGQGLARPDSLCAAIRLAGRLVATARQRS